RGCAVGRLKLRARPERAWQHKAGKRLVGNSGVERRQNRVEPSRNFTFITAGNDQPERLAFLPQNFFDGVERRVSLTVTRAQGVGGSIHFRQTGKQDDGAKQNQRHGDDENNYCEQPEERRSGFGLENLINTLLQRGVWRTGWIQNR